MIKDRLQRLTTLLLRNDKKISDKVNKVSAQIDGKIILDKDSNSINMYTVEEGTTTENTNFFLQLVQSAYHKIQIFGNRFEITSERKKTTYSGDITLTGEGGTTTVTNNDITVSYSGQKVVNKNGKVMATSDVQIVDYENNVTVSLADIKKELNELKQNLENKG